MPVEFEAWVDGQDSRLAVTVIWATYETTHGTPSYRAGVRFVSANPEPVEAFWRRHGHC